MICKADSIESVAYDRPSRNRHSAFRLIYFVQGIECLLILVTRRLSISIKGLKCTLWMSTTSSCNFFAFGVDKSFQGGLESKCDTEMTVIVPEARLCEDEWIQGEGKSDENNIDHSGSGNSLLLDGGFVVPETNALGHHFRDYYQGGERTMGVEEFYRIHHFNQTYEFALSKREKYGKLGKCVMSIWECCQLLSEYVDESDPDLDEPQIEHLLQTAEAIRKDYPNEDWLHLTAFIHDLGKVLLHPRFGGEPQWAVVGDTYPLGCAFDESIVHHKSGPENLVAQYLMENPDYRNPKYNTKYGIYSEKCGLENVIMSWGHDEYMYMVAKHNNTTLPPRALFIIRFHSFYALYGNGAYTHLMNDQDKEMLDWLKKFSKYDLYSKSNVRIDVEAVKPYYLSLIEKYFPSELRW